MIKKDAPVFLLPESLRILGDRLEHSLGERFDELHGDIKALKGRLSAPVVLPALPLSAKVAGRAATGAASGEAAVVSDHFDEGRVPPDASAGDTSEFTPGVLLWGDEVCSDGSNEPSTHSFDEATPSAADNAGEPLPAVRSTEPDHVYTVQSCWKKVIVTNKKALLSVVQGASNSQHHYDEVMSFQPSRHSLGEISRLIVRPSSRTRLAWDVLSMLVIGYDMVTIPFTLAFLTGENDTNDFLTFMFWWCLVWWTSDIPLSLVTGYYKHGIEELRPRYIVIAYLRSWALFDVLIVGADWSSVILGSRLRGASMVRMGKTLRFLRVVRSLRLLRLTKVRRILEAIQDRIASEWFHIVLGVLKLSFLLLLFNHLLACIWWGLSNASSPGTASWAADERYAGASMGYQYFTSLHWTITQFTPAGMEVSPHNFHERVFAVFVCLIAMIFFSNFVSSITAAMTQLRQLSSQTNKEFAILRRFLRDRKIHGNLRLRIIRYAEHRVSMRKSETQEQDVTLLKVLSNPLRVELVVQSRAPVLTQHPFFMHYHEADPDAMSQVCCNAVIHGSFSRGDMLFTVGVHCEHMVFVFRGGLVYFPENPLTDEAPSAQTPEASTVSKLSKQVTVKMGSQGNQEVTFPTGCDPTHVGEKEWCCEQALWTSWTHLGTLRATAMSEVLLVSAASFRDITLAHSRVAHRAAKYGKAFVDVVNGNKGHAKTSDIVGFNPQSLAEEVFFSPSAERASSTGMGGSSGALDTQDSVNFGFRPA